MKKFVLCKIEVPANSRNNSHSEFNMVQRLYDLGFHPGLQIEIVGKVSFNSVYIVQFLDTRIALNEEEFACLHGP